MTLLMIVSLYVSECDLIVNLSLLLREFLTSRFYLGGGGGVDGMEASPPKTLSSL